MQHHYPYIYNSGYRIIYNTPLPCVNYEKFYNQFNPQNQSDNKQYISKIKAKPDTKEILNKELTEKTRKIANSFKRLDFEKFSSEEKRVKQYISVFSDVLNIIDKVGVKNGCFFDYKEFYNKADDLYNWIKNNILDKNGMLDFLIYFQDRVVSYFY